MKYFYFLFFLSMVFTSCHKEEELTSDSNAKLEFSTDTLYFDTLFTSTQSITRRVKVYNKNSKAVNISSIELGGKASSPYNVTINGQTTWYQNNVSLRGGDSMYVLVSINIAQGGGANLPFVVNDSIVFHTNGNMQQVQLLAIGQDATFINGKTIPCDTVWTDTKPFVIYNKAVVPQGCTLTIEKGVNLYFHNKAFLSIAGTLIVKGEKGDEVIFSGDNLSSVFKDLPGQWNGIVFEATSTGSKLDYFIVQNAVEGIVIENNPSDMDTAPDLVMNNCIVKNMSLTGVAAYNRDVLANNCLFTNCVRSVFAGLGGGNYMLNYCTLVNTSYDFFREDSTLTFSNTSLLPSVSLLNNPLSAQLTNCIVWGDYPEEILLVDNGTEPFIFQPNHCLLATQKQGYNNNGNIINQDPLFVSLVKKDYHLGSNSPAIDKGTPLSITIDLEGNTRGNPPDMGAYEK